MGFPSDFPIFRLDSVDSVAGEQVENRQEMRLSFKRITVESKGKKREKKYTASAPSTRSHRQRLQEKKREEKQGKQAGRPNNTRKEPGKYQRLLEETCIETDGAEKKDPLRRDPLGKDVAMNV